MAVWELWYIIILQQHLSIHRVKWHHISVVTPRSPFCGAIRRTVVQLLRYSNNTEPVGLRKCPYHYYITKKVISQYQSFSTACPTKWRKTAGIDMIWRNYDYDTVTLFVLYVLWQQIVDEDWKKTSSTLIAQQQQLQPTFLNYTKLHQYILLKSLSHHLLTATFFSKNVAIFSQRIAWITFINLTDSCTDVQVIALRLFAFTDHLICW